MKQESFLKDLRPSEERIVVKIPAPLKRRFEKALALRGQSKKFVFMKTIEDYIKETESMEPEF